MSDRHRIGAVLLGLLLCACETTGPGAGIKRPSYPSLAASTTTYRWLVVKCQLADVPTIPPGLDRSIEQFFGIAGAGYGNVLDYWHDVSYNHASVYSDTIVGWIPVPTRSSDVNSSAKRLGNTQACLQAIPADQLPDLDGFYGVVAINNKVNDAGSCVVGKTTITVRNKAYQLACLWFDPNSLQANFAAHEFGHGLGLNHSYDDSMRNCGGWSTTPAGEYCDAWDIMSAAYWFPDPNWPIAGAATAAGPGVNAATAFQMGWIPVANQRRYDLEQGGEQVFKVSALSRPRPGQPLIVLLDTGSPTAFDGRFTIEYRQAEGWDQGFGSHFNVPAPARASNGAVLVHQYRKTGDPLSRLILGAYQGALQPLDTMVVNGGGLFHVRVLSFDTKNAIATIVVGPGTGPPLRHQEGIRISH